MGAMAQASSQVKRRRDNFVLKADSQDSTGSLGRVNELLQVGVRHVDEALADVLEVETVVMRGHHRQSPLHASVESVAYPLTHTTRGQ
jgi:hypothetical protein